MPLRHVPCFFRNLYIFSWFSIALPQHHGKQDMSLVASPFVFMSLDGLGSECGQTKEKTIEWHLKLKLKQIWLGEIKWICHGTWKCDTQDVWYCFTTQFLDPKPTIPLLAELLQAGCLAENNTAAVHPFTVKNKCLLRIGIQGAVCGKKKTIKNGEVILVILVHPWCFPRMVTQKLGKLGTLTVKIPIF